MLVCFALFCAISQLSICVLNMFGLNSVFQGQIKKNLSCKCVTSGPTCAHAQQGHHSVFFFFFCFVFLTLGEEIARPRRSTPTASPVPDTPRSVTAADVRRPTPQQHSLPWIQPKSVFLSDVLHNVPSFFGQSSETRYARYDGLLANDRTTGRRYGEWG